MWYLSFYFETKSLSDNWWFRVHLSLQCIRTLCMSQQGINVCKGKLYSCFAHTIQLCSLCNQHCRPHFPYLWQWQGNSIAIASRCKVHLNLASSTNVQRIQLLDWIVCLYTMWLNRHIQYFLICSCFILHWIKNVIAGWTTVCDIAASLPTFDNHYFTPSLSFWIQKSYNRRR